MIKARTLRANEPHPEGFFTGYEKMPIEHDWVWVAEQDGNIVGMILAGACHGMIYIMRLCTKNGANPIVIRALFEKMRADCLERGYKGYFFHVDPTRKLDGKMLKLCRGYGGIQITIPQAMLVGSLEKRCRA